MNICHTLGYTGFNAIILASFRTRDPIFLRTNAGDLDFLLLIAHTSRKKMLQ